MMRAEPKWDIQEVSPDQLVEVVTANGLELVGEGLFTPDGTRVGVVHVGKSKSKAKVVLLSPEYEDRHQVVRAWWPGFRRAWSITTGDRVSLGPVLGPDEVICDICNRRVQMRPVPVVNEYALCRDCFSDTGLAFPTCPDELEPYDVSESEDEGRGVSV
jgi:hypothetical protein